MRVLTSFSLLGGTARCAHNTRGVVHGCNGETPGGISRRGNLNSWKSEWEDAGERVERDGNGAVKGEEKEENKDKGVSEGGREGGKEEGKRERGRSGSRELRPMVIGG